MTANVETTTVRIYESTSTTVNCYDLQRATNGNHRITRRLLAGNRRALARTISLVEDGGPEAHACSRRSIRTPAAAT